MLSGSLLITTCNPAIQHNVPNRYRISKGRTRPLKPVVYALGVDLSPQDHLMINTNLAGREQAYPGGTNVLQRDPI